MKYGDRCYVLRYIWFDSYRKHKKLYHGYRYRIDSVPFIGKRRWRFSNYYRRMRTTQERRTNYAYEGYTRGKRRNLSEAWDDIPRSNYYDRSWKNCTKKSKFFLYTNDLVW